MICSLKNRSAPCFFMVFSGNLKLQTLSIFQKHFQKISLGATRKTVGEPAWLVLSRERRPPQALSAKGDLANILLIYV